MQTLYGLLGTLLVVQTMFGEILYVPTEFATPAAAIAAAVDGDTVLLEPGTHTGQIAMDVNIVLASEYILTGDTATIAGTILRAPNNPTSHVISVNGLDSTAQIAGLTIRGGQHFDGGGIFCSNASLIIRNNIIEDNLADAGGGVLCENSPARILHNTIRDNAFISPLGNPGGGIAMLAGSDGEIAFNRIHGNSNQDGGGIALQSSSPWIHNNIIYDNQALDLGGGMRIDDSNPLVESNVFHANVAGTVGGGIYVSAGASPAIRNCILWNNVATTASQLSAASTVSVTYCAIEGGRNGVGNIEDDPLFRAPTSEDFHLASVDCGTDESSPCIDAGDSLLGDFHLSCDKGLGTMRSDMGAYGGQAPAAPHRVPNNTVTDNAELVTAYPNPFNATVSVRFFVHKQADVTLSLFNSIGQKVTHQFLGGFARGTYERELSLTGYPSGIYFVKLNVGDQNSATKIVFSK